MHIPTYVCVQFNSNTVYAHTYVHINLTMYRYLSDITEFAFHNDRMFSPHTLFLLFLRVLSASVQLLDSVSKKPASEDETFSKKKIVEKKNRYKDRFPCELQQG